MRCESRDGLPLVAGAPGARAAGGTAAGLTLAQAEGLLDWLETHGDEGLGAALLEDGGVTVFWGGRGRQGVAHGRAGPHP
jgi:hypothetical protein